MNDSPSADPTQALEQRKLVDVANRLPVDGRDHVAGKEAGTLRGTSRREPLHVDPAIDVRSGWRVVEKAEAEPAGATAGGVASEQHEPKERYGHGDSVLHDVRSTTVSVPGASIL